MVYLLRFSLCFVAVSGLLIVYLLQILQSPSIKGYTDRFSFIVSVSGINNSRNDNESRQVALEQGYHCIGGVNYTHSKQGQEGKKMSHKQRMSLRNIHEREKLFGRVYFTFYNLYLKFGGAQTLFEMCDSSW